MEGKEEIKVYIINDKGSITLYKDRTKAERDFYKKAYEYREMIYSYKYVNHDKDNLIHYVKKVAAEKVAAFLCTREISRKK